MGSQTGMDVEATRAMGPTELIEGRAHFVQHLYGRHLIASDGLDHSGFKNISALLGQA